MRIVKSCPPSRRGRLVLAVALTALAFIPMTAAGEPADSRPTANWTTDFLVAQQQPAATDEFVPVSELPPEEQLPAAPLLIAAYMFVWVVLLVYVFALWRKLAKVEHELADVTRQVEQQRRS